MSYEAGVYKIDDSIKCIPKEIATHVSIIHFGKNHLTQLTHTKWQRGGLCQDSSQMHDPGCILAFHLGGTTGHKGLL
jgi:hypothetical protein